MDDFLLFFGNAQKIIIETAQIQKSTFSDKEGKKGIILTAEYDYGGNILKKTSLDKVENFLYENNLLTGIIVNKTDKTPKYKEDYYYENNLLIKKKRISSDGIITDEEIYHYNSDGKLQKKQSKSLTYEYIYSQDLLVEERWHSDFNLNQIIRYAYENDLLIEILHLSGSEVPGRKIQYKRNKSGFITEEIVYSASNLIVSHFKYEYGTIYKKNWLKRVKYTLHSQNKRKEATEAQYRDFKFYETPETIDETETTDQNYVLDTENEIKSDNYQEIEFDNGIYKGEITNGLMHGNGIFIFSTGTIYQGTFKNNVMEGRGKLSYITGKVYEGTFINSVLEGPGACKWPNGDFYVGEFKNGKMHGRGCYIWDNGNRFEGLFDLNKRTEQGILYKKSELESDAPPEWVNELFKGN